jgi:hypothetical protein
MASTALHGCHACDLAARSGRALETPLIDKATGKRDGMRKILFALASLAAFAMAVGAGWKPN